MSSNAGIVNKDISAYVVIKPASRLFDANVYTMADDAGNVFIFETDKTIDGADGNNYFLIEGVVKECKELSGVRQTVLTDCEWELIGNANKMQGVFYGTAGEIVQIDNVTAKFRRVYDTEWISNGEFTVVAPISEYRLIFDEYNCTFMLPYDPLKKLNFKSFGKFNIKGKIIGYRIEKGVKMTFLYPITINDKNGPFYSSKPHTSRRL